MSICKICNQYHVTGDPCHTCEIERLHTEVGQKDEEIETLRGALRDVDHAFDDCGKAQEEVKRLSQVESEWGETWLAERAEVERQAKRLEELDASYQLEYDEKLEAQAQVERLDKENAELLDKLKRKENFVQEAYTTGFKDARPGDPVWTAERVAKTAWAAFAARKGLSAQAEGGG